MSDRLSRRRFVGLAAASGAGFWIAGRRTAYGQEASPNARLNIAVIGSGGRGAAHLGPLAAENVVALCDVFEPALEKAARTLAQARPGAPAPRRYVDFRKLYDEMAREIDAVVVSTAEHTHFHAVLPALLLDKHVYVEKPMTHGVWEARRLTEEARRRPKVATQMGIQMHASETYRRVVELLQAGTIGPVTEVHVWVERSWGWQSPAEAKANGDILSTQERPAKEDPVPEGLHWDLWLGPGPARPFNRIYVPGPRWYRWWDWGSGTMSDLGSHYNDLPFWALKLDAPRTVEGFGPPPHPDLAPANFRAVYEYGPREGLPPVKLHWYQGTEKPPHLRDGSIPPNWKSGHLFVGEKGMLLSSYGKYQLLPESKFADFRAPERTLPRSPGHLQEWILAAKGEGKTLAPFEYSGPLTEANHLASIAYRVGKKLEWDAAALKARNAPEADPLIRRAYRKGWEPPG
ncbi:MAG TPA: Gfo/Idh/MocA family oxidoreductase [Planctomycetota bacterium]|nr:Gfo/Idh/MocA family oxidoreductase [Planctomycetota bacterium]